MIGQPQISVIVCTYNRCDLLRKVLRSVIEQDAAGIVFEIIVVDNNSSDETRPTVESLINDSGGKLRYVFEPRQGNAYARNTGIKHASAPITAFLDDDVWVERDWLRTIKEIFEQHPELVVVGGRVLPSWESAPPSWLTPEHWSPIAVLDYGDERLLLSDRRPLCLLTANIAFRRDVFEKVGIFSEALQRVRGGIGSIEDHELLMRIWRSGHKGMYLPELAVATHVGKERMTKRYHRRWHTGHGRFYAIMRDPEWEHSNQRFLGVPAHVFRQTLVDALGWFKSIVKRNRDQAFLHERQLRFFAGFFIQRQRQ